MKKTLLLFAILVVASGLVFADGHGFYGTPEGEWKLAGSRLYQNDEAAPRAKAWFKAPQNGPMVYEFTMRYEGGGDDGHGGVGIHILSDASTTGKSWGFGESWLLWVNYDVSADTASGHVKGLSAEVYKSDTNKVMSLVATVDLNAYIDLLLDNIDADIPVKLTFYPDEGRLEIDDPRGETAGWYYNLPGADDADGSFVAVRTNSLSVSFTSPDVDI